MTTRANRIKRYRLDAKKPLLGLLAPKFIICMPKKLYPGMLAPHQPLRALGSEWRKRILWHRAGRCHRAPKVIIWVPKKTVSRPVGPIRAGYGTLVAPGWK
eukprot:gene17473-biopygen18888